MALIGLTGLALGWVPGLAPLADAAPTLTPGGTAGESAAAWLGRQLAGQAGLAQTAQGRTDYPTTVAAILGLAAAGVGADQIRASAAALAQAGEAFIGSPAQIGLKTTAIAQLILAMDTAGLDPTRLATSDGTRDLYADLAGAVRPDGQVGQYASVTGQAVAIMALSQSPQPMPGTVIQWLGAWPCADAQQAGVGGFGLTVAGSCADVDTDATALVVRALVMAGLTASPIFAPAVAYLVKVQDSFGGWPTAWAGVNAASTGLALWALRSASTVPGLPDLTLAIGRGEQYVASVSYDCAVEPGAVAPAATLGAIAYDGAIRHSPAGASAPGAVGLTQSTARAILAYSRGDAGLPEAGSAGLPAGLTCPAGDSTASAGSGDAATPPADSADLAAAGAAPWLWAGGALLVLVAAFFGWRRLRS